MKPLRTNLNTIAMQTTLRKYQINALRSMNSVTEGTHTMCLFCGTGKTIIFTEYIISKIQKTQKYWACVVVPSIALITQYKHDYIQKYFSEKINTLCVCSREELAEKKGRLTFCTDADEISQHVQKFKKNKHSSIILSTYKSLDNLATALSQMDITLDVAIFDEAHRTTSETIQKHVWMDDDDSEYQSELDSEYNSDDCESELDSEYNSDCEDSEYKSQPVIQSKLKFLFTATPVCRNGVDMFKKDFLFRYTFHESVFDGYTQDFQLCMDVFNSDISIEDQYATHMRCIVKHMIASGNHKVMSFHIDVKNSIKHFYKFLQKNIQKYWRQQNQTNKIHVVEIESKTKNRVDILKDFDESPDAYIVLSCRTIGEGVDTKMCDMVYFYDTKTNPKDIVQNIGRAVRKKAHDRQSTIVVPLCVSKSEYENLGTQEEKNIFLHNTFVGDYGNYSAIMYVQLALRQQDTEYYDSCLKFPHKLTKCDFILNNPEIQFEKITDEQFDELKKENNIEMISDEPNTDPTYFECENQSIEPSNVCVFKDVEDGYHIVHGDIQNKKMRKGRVPRFNCDFKEWGVDWDIDFDVNEDADRAILKGSMKKTDEEKKQEAYSIIEFYEKEGRWPNRGSKDETEKIHAEYLNRYRTAENNQNNTYINQRNILNQRFGEIWKGYKFIKKTDEDKKQDANWIIKFYEKEGRWPSKGSNNPIEINYATLLCDSYRKAERNGNDRYKTERKILNQEFGNTWINGRELDKNKTEEDKKQEANWIIEFYEKEARWPRGSKDETEKSHAGYLNKYRDAEKKQNNLYKIQREILNKRFGKEWHRVMKTTLEHKNDAHRIINYSVSTKKWPSQNSECKIEKKYGQYLSDYRKAEKKQDNGCKIQRKIFNHYFGGDSWIDGRSNDVLQKYHDLLPNLIESPASTEFTVSNDSIESTSSPTQSESESETSNSSSPNENSPNENSPNEKVKSKRKSKKTDEYTPKTMPKPNTENPEIKRVPVKSESDLSKLHREYKRQRSDNLHKYFQENRAEWEHYHRVSEENEQTFEVIPRNRIVDELKKLKRKNKRIVDMGCGKTLISSYFENEQFEFINYDHIAIDKSVIECDIANMPLEDESVDIAILCLAMWGSNCEQYLLEANRVLDGHGVLYIIEATKKWDSEDNRCGRLKGLIEQSRFKIVEQDIKKFSFFKCIKV